MSFYKIQNSPAHSPTFTNKIHIQIYSLYTQDTQVILTADNAVLQLKLDFMSKRARCTRMFSETLHLRMSIYSWFIDLICDAHYVCSVNSPHKASHHSPPEPLYPLKGVFKSQISNPKGHLLSLLLRYHNTPLGKFYHSFLTHPKRDSRVQRNRGRSCQGRQT